MREFETGATRDSSHGKPDYEGYLSPLVLAAFGEYMLRHQETANGPRESDDWQRGIPMDVYMKSLLRHVFALWALHRGEESSETVEDSACAILFNTQGYLLEHLKQKKSSGRVASKRIGRDAGDIRITFDEGGAFATEPSIIQIDASAEISVDEL